MNKTKYYLPIKSVNLAHYFSKGCVCPTKYIENRTKDIQSEFYNCLLFSKNKFTENTNCSLEIILNKEEKVEEITGDFFLFEIPLPISRVKKIIFKKQQKKDDTTSDITRGAAFLPKLIKVDSDSQESKSIELEAVKYTPPDKDWSDKIKLYNRVMGGVAIMSIAGNEYQDYPLNYFNTLSIFNTIIKDEIKNQSIEVNNNYEWAFIKESQYKDLYDTIHSEINNDSVEEFAKQDKTHLPKKRNGIYPLDEITVESKTYLVAILALYGDKGARKKLDTFISDLVSNKFPEKKKEGLALIFGINKGYEAFRNSYKTENFKVDIKFKLDSQLDYYTIESIYQFVFNDKRDNSAFKYIDDCFSKLEPETENNKEFETYKILDKIVRYKKKEEDFFEKIFKEISRDKIYQKITSEIQKWIPYTKDKDDLVEGVKYFKDLLENSFKKYVKTIYNRVKDEMENKSSKQIETLKSQHLEEDDNKTENHLKEIKSLKDEISFLEERIKERDIENTRLKEENENLKSQHLEEDDNKTKIHSKEIEDLKSQHSKDNNNKTESHLKEIEDLKSQHSKDDNNKIKSQHSKEIEDLGSKVIPQEKAIKDAKFEEENKKLKEKQPEKDLNPISNKGDTIKADDLFTNHEEKKEPSNYKERMKLLNNEKVTELRKIAKDHKITNYTKCRKGELVEKILKAEYSK